MRVIALFLFLFTSSHVFAQADTSYHLLWYQGRKIRPNVLIQPNGDTVRYDPVKRTVKVTSSTGDGKKFDNMLAELGKTKQRMEEMMKRFSYLPKPLLPPLSLIVRDAFTEADAECRKLLSNTMTLPDMHKSVITAKNGKGSVHTGNIEEDWEKLIEEFQDFRDKHKNDLLAVLPEPPKFDYSYCSACDNAKETAYKKAVADFIEALIGKEEQELMKKAKWASTFIYDMYPGRLRDDLDHEIKVIIPFLLKRIETKISRMIQRYCDDPERAMTIMDVAVSAERELQLMGYAGRFPEYSGRAFDAYTKRIERALAEYDYTIALNHKLVLLYDRKMQVYYQRMNGLVDKVMKFNRFKMNMDISAKATDNDGYLLAALEGDNWFSAYVDAKECRLKWQLESPKINKAIMQLKEAELVGNGGRATYAASKNWLTTEPFIKLDFCDEEREDSITVYPFSEENFREAWTFPVIGTQDVLLANGVLLGCFMDVERTKKEGAEFKADPEKIEKLKQEILAQHKQWDKAMKSGTIKTGQVNMDYYKELAGAKVISQSIQEVTLSVNPGRYIFTPVLYNKDKIIVKDKIDGKILFPENTATEYALFNITIENDPRR